MKSAATAAVLEPLVTDDEARTALIVEADAILARRCLLQLAEWNIHAKVVWTRREAVELLASDAESFAFAYVDLALRDGSELDVAAEARRLRPLLPLVVASNDIEDVLTADGVVLCKPFTSEQFRTAFDAALLDEQQVLRAGAKARGAVARGRRQARRARTAS